MRTTHARVRRLTVAAMLTAVIIVLTVTPIGFTLPFFGISMTFVHIPMILGAVMEGPGTGTLLGAVFGLTSFWKNLNQPTSVYSYMFQNPLVSVLPRVLIGPCLWGVILLLRKALPGKKKLQYAISGAVGALLNTVLTLTALTICNALSGGAYEGVSALSIWMLSANAPIEMISAAIVTTAVMTALSKVYRKDEP